MRERAPAIAVAIALVAIAAAYAAGTGIGADYASPNCPRSPICDDSGRSIDALIEGDLDRFFRDQPVSGPLTLVLRAPFAAKVRAFGGTVVDEYRAGSFACLLAVAALGLLLFELLRRGGAPLWLQLIAAGAAVVNPMTPSVLSWGHPEDLVAGSLVVASLLIALTGHPRAAAIAFGLGLAAKLWVLLAAVPLLALLAPAARLRAALTAAAVAAVFVVPMALGDPGAFREALGSVGKFGSEPGSLTQASAWWAAGHDTTFVQAEVHEGALVLVRHEGWQLSDTAARLAHPLIVALAVLAGVLWWRRWPRPEDRRRTALALVALVFLLRAPLDPANHSYYHLPFLLSLLAWETFARRRPPVVTGLAILGLHLLRSAPATLGDGAFNAVYLTGAGLFAAYLCAAAFAQSGNVRPRWNSNGGT